MKPLQEKALHQAVQELEEGASAANSMFFELRQLDAKVGEALALLGKKEAKEKEQAIETLKNARIQVYKYAVSMDLNPYIKISGGTEWVRTVLEEQE